jgi:hypothetical protein
VLVRAVVAVLLVPKCAGEGSGSGSVVVPECAGEGAASCSLLVPEFTSEGADCGSVST